MNGFRCNHVAISPALQTILCYTTLIPIISDGPFWHRAVASSEPCSRLWWTNLLWISTLYPADTALDTQCMGWSWYLSNDMLLYMTAPPLLVLPYLLYSRRTAVILTLCCVAALIAYGAQFLHQEGLSAIVDFNAIDGVEHNRAYSRLFYQKPWMRAPAYLLGILLAFAFDVWEQRRSGEMMLPQVDPPISELQQRDHYDSQQGLNDPLLETNVDRLLSPGSESTSRLCAPRHWPGRLCRSYEALCKWLVPSVPPWPHCAALALAYLASMGTLALVFFAPATAYSSVPSSWSAEVQLAYSALSRPAWAAALAVILLLCGAGYGGPVSALLGSPVWVPLARLSFGAYLLHPIVQQATFLSQTSLARYSAMGAATAFLSTLTLSYAAAGVLYLCVEAPTASLERLLLLLLLHEDVSAAPPVVLSETEAALPALTSVVASVNS